MKTMIDTHAHIYTEEFQLDLPQVLQRAREQGISKIFLPATDLESSRQVIQLSAAHPGMLYPMIGLHPTDVGADYKRELEGLRLLLNQYASHIIGIGEIGLDYYWDTTFREEQIAALQIQMDWALSEGLPVMLHVRAAHQDLMQVMEKYRNTPLRGVFHSFCGTAEEAAEMLSYEGFCLGVNGMVTFKKSTLPEVLPEIPLERIVLETDAPYLAPVPFRGKRNESAYIPCIVKKLAEIYGCTEEEVSEQTTSNAQNLFAKVL